jgi:ABC-2 type transport system permease protein
MVGTWRMLPVLMLLGISGIFTPIQDLWGWLQCVAQVFPMYWVGLGMRSASYPMLPRRSRSGGRGEPRDRFGARRLGDGGGSS